MQNSTCIACNGTNFHTTGHLINNRFPLCNCPDCGLSFLDIKPEDEQSADFDDYWGDVNEKIYTHADTIAELSRKYDRYFKLLDDAPNRRLLDVGSGSGICVNTAKQHGFEPTGIEPSERGVQIARRQFDVDVQCALLGTDDDLPRNFGVLTLWDVIEHVHDPEEMARTCAAHLDKGGYFVLETPDEGAFIRSLIRGLSRFGSVLDFRKNMYYRAHRTYFTCTAMRLMLERSGFTDVRFYKERTMYGKAILKQKLFHRVSGFKEMALRVTYWLLNNMPLTQNKMVVIARKA